MSLGIVFKGSEGIVLAADSRVTLTARRANSQVLLPAHFDNATKLLKVAGQQFVAAVTYGAGAIDEMEPRTAHSFMPEFEATLQAGRLTVQDFAQKLSDFFLKQWQSLMPSGYSGPDMVFLVGGYDDGQPYGRMFELFIPTNPTPSERNPSPEFGMVWGGQREYVDRLIRGYDDGLLIAVKDALSLDDAAINSLAPQLQSKLQVPIPFQFLPLQDSVDLAVYLVRATIAIQAFIVGVRGAGGAIDVATITRMGGFKAVQEKTIHGEE